MEKQKTGFWKAHPLLKAITVLVVFYLVMYFSLYCLDIPIIAPIVYVFQFFYMAIGLYILGGIYGIWIDCRCHLKLFSFCLIFLVLIIIVAIDYVFRYVYPDWSHYGYFSWYDIHLTINYAYTQIASVVGGYILSRIISHIIKKMKQNR